ncbi:hypothetical protein [Pseudomonas fluorescens]|uniref:Uncharacterized protein n=1 Tax=Pseudomonas fluorescens TaxID=294 RepID=A0A5E7DJ60_PSEFL|nr:hypothetical protein [Pseudomonas fluorescens]VVO08284.1 hypothetical protein PS710_03235 [Pseudomonas fluorescens]
MIHALNMTMPLKQDPQSQQKLEKLKAGFAGGTQQMIGAALAKSELVHFARVLVIDNKYIQVLTEFDGDKTVYALFFLEELPGVFKAIFELVEDVPPWDELVSSPDLFFDVSQRFNVRALGTKEDDQATGWLFSAFGTKTVKDIKAALAK